MNTINKLYYILFFSLTIIACKESTPSESMIIEESTDDLIRVTKKQFESSDFKLGKITNMSFPTMLNASGTIHLPEKSQASVSSMLSGTIGAVDWMEGQWVSRGTSLFSISNPELINMQEDYLVTKEQLSYLREEYKRQSELASENITTKKDLLKIKSELNTAEARHSAVSKKLDLYGIKTDQLSTSNLKSTLSIIAPISGYITEVNILRGAYLESSTMALKIENTNQVHLELSVLEKDATHLKKGEEINFSAQNKPNKKYKAKINIIQKSIDPNGMITVQANLDDQAKKELLQGMYVNAQIEISNQEAEALPQDAFVKLYDDWYTLQLESQDTEGYKFTQVKVKVGEQVEGQRSATGLSSDAEYLVKGAYFLIQ